MIAFNLYIDKYDWLVRVYVKVSHLDTDEIVESLKSIGCRGNDLRKSYDMILSGDKNSGICYSNTIDRISVMVISRTSTPAEFFNSAIHEISHLATQICVRDRISLVGEEKSYLQGDIGKMMYPMVKKLLCCECANNSIKKYLKIK